MYLLFQLNKYQDKTNCIYGWTSINWSWTTLANMHSCKLISFPNQNTFALQITSIIFKATVRDLLFLHLSTRMIIKLCISKLWDYTQYIDGLAQDCNNSFANALELLQSCTKPSILWSEILGALPMTKICKCLEFLFKQSKHKNKGYSTKLSTEMYQTQIPP